MKILSRFLVLLLAALPLVSLAHRADASEVITVTGEFGYRERIALLPGSTATLTLSDVSRQDVAAPIIAEATFPISGVPVPFELKTASGALQPDHTYALRAVIRDRNGALRWTTDTMHRVDPDQARTDLGLLLLKRVASQPGPQPQADLTGGEWLVEDINRRGVMDIAQTTLSFDEEGNVFGSGGCNRYRGGYELSGDQLGFGPLATTQMACPEAVSNQERAFLQVLAAAPLRLAFDDTGALILTGEDGQSLKARRK
jgi:putative lipoprotein